jgi:methylase of polypeptide subunit release factors
MNLMMCGAESFDCADSQVNWSNVGVHPTPASLVRFFSKVVVSAIREKFPNPGPITVLDACAGDGRLGHSVARRLMTLGFAPSVIFVESRPEQVIRSAKSYETLIVRGDFLSLPIFGTTDVVISNPPYLSLSRSKASKLGVSWSDALLGAQNLYGLALARCLEHCVPEGVVGILAPHGWLSNQRAACLRRFVAARASSITVDAFSSRRLFPGVHQDVAVQIIRKRSIVDSSGNVVVARIGYDRGERMPFLLSLEDVGKPVPEVKIGAFVWNREQDKIAKKSTGWPVIYGGNIASDGVLRCRSRYWNRAYLLRSKTPLSYIHRAPCIVIKRSMRGVPGQWKLDLAVVSKRGFKFVAENHVIVVSFSSKPNISFLRKIARDLSVHVEEAHKHYGHPNVSVSLIRSALRDLQPSNV